MESVEREGNSTHVDLIRPLMVYRKWIAVAAVACAILVLIFKLLSAANYTAVAALAPVDNNSTGAGKLGQFSGLAGLAGVSLGDSSGPSNFDRFTYLLTSPELAEWEIKHRDVISTLYPDWDDKAHDWRAPSDFWGRIASMVREKKSPDQFDIAKILDAHITITRVSTSDALRVLNAINLVHYTDKNPAVSNKMLRYVVEDANEIIRERAQVRARMQSNFLSNELNTVQNREYRDTLMRLYSEQEQTLMLAGSNLPYAAELLSGSYTPADRDPKKTAITVVIGGMVGLCFAYFVAIVVFNLRRPSSKRTGGR
jgi:hypothetical protein